MIQEIERMRQTKIFNKTAIDFDCKYYLGENKNIYIRNFVEENMNSAKPLQPIDLPISQTVKKTGSLYDVHSYWSKKPYLAIERFINHYTRPGDIVLDPFCGCGSTLQASLGLGRNAIGVDICPSATHITANTILYTDVDSFMNEANAIINDVDKEINSIYSIKVGRQTFLISSLIHSESIKCIKCLKHFPLLIPGTADARSDCPYCKEPFSTRSHNIDYGPSSVRAIEIRESYESNRGKIIWHDSKPELFEEISLSQEMKGKAKKIRDLLAYPVPKRLLDLGGRLTTSGSNTLGLLFEDRALITLYILKQRILEVNNPALRSKLLLAFTGTLKNCSKMYRFHEGGGGSPIGAYYVPPIRKELNPIFSFKDKIKSISNSINEIGNWGKCKYIVSTQNSAVLDIPSNSIDYIFTDPPYADTMPFGALNFIWDGWISPDWNWMSCEAIGENWKKILLDVFSESHRILKPNAYCSVCYHDTSEGTWSDLLDVMAEAGFKSVIGKDVLYIETTQRAYQQTVADKVVKRDHVVNFIKLSPNVLYSFEAEKQKHNITFNELSAKILRDTLMDNPGISKDRIYDVMTAKLIEVGRLEPHDFESLLETIAVQGEGVKNQWFLKDNSILLDSAESMKEDLASEAISAFIKNTLTEKQWLEGVHYSDIFEYYVYTVKDKPRRSLAEWLLDYFFKTDQGTYRLPITDEEKRIKAEGRSKGTQRRIKHYIAFLQQGVSIPDKELPNDATLAEWLRHCKRSGLYEQGKLLYEKGGLRQDNLSEEAMVNVEEDYQVCIRMLARSGDSNVEVKTKRGRKAKS